MSAYNQEFNKDNVILRYVIVGLLAELRNKIYFYNQIDEETVTKINVPFYYSVTGNERFLLDTFLFGATENGEAVGDYEVVPRGVAQLSGISIDSGSMTNKFIRSQFVREFQGQLKTFSLETAFLPINLSFDITVVCSNNLEMLKVTESIMSKLYKATFFQIDLGMMRVQASLEVPEDYSQERLFEYALNDKKEFNVTFPIEVKTFMPVFENGILLSEIIELTKETAINPNNVGIGMYRNNEIRFGGVLQEIDYTIDDIRKAPTKDVFSNKGYIDPNLIQTGPVFLDSTVNTAEKDTESKASKEYRNDEET